MKPVPRMFFFFFFYLQPVGLHTHFYDKGDYFLTIFFYDNPHLTTTVYTLEKQQEQSKMLSVTLFVANYRAVSHPVGDKQWRVKLKRNWLLLLHCMVPQRH
jgi:peptide methionine sulfoxide reductase MsrA